MPVIAKNNFGLGWFPDADEVNAPDGALLRADNLVLDETGALALRAGSSKLDSSLVGGAAHTVRSFYLNDTLHRFAAVGDKLYRNGVDTGLVFTGSGDFSFGTDAYQTFVARGTTRKKYDGTNFFDWNIKAPTGKPILSKGNAITSTVAEFDASESDTFQFTTTEGTKTLVAGPSGAANGASQFTVDSAGRASAYKTFTADKDFLTIQGVEGGGTDIFDMYAAVSDWDKMQSVTVMFGLGTGTDPFLDDYYYFDWNIRENQAVNVQNPAAAIASVQSATAIDVARTVDPIDITRTNTPAEIMRIKAQIGEYAPLRSRARKDAAQSSPAWFHFSTTRAQFLRTGASDRTWRTVRGFKVVVKTVAGGTYTATFSTTLWYGGGARALTGTFRALVVAVRDTGNYFELSPPSPISDEIVLNQNALTVKVPAAVISGLDPQVTNLWVFLFSNSLGGWYRFAITGGTQTFGMSMDEFDPSPDGVIDSNDWIRFHQWGLTIPGFTGIGDFNILIGRSEIDALREGVSLVPYLSAPPENIVSIAGPYLGRMFALTDEGWLYVSAQDSPSHFNGLHIQDLRRYGDPKWMVRTNGGIFVGMTQDIIRLGGTGDEDINGNVDFFPDPLGVGNPPVDEAFYTDGNAIVYRAADGLMSLAGVTAVPVTQEGNSLLWRGRTRHGVSALNIETGRFRLAVDNHVLYMLAPEGLTTSGTTNIWRYDTVQNRWYRTTYAASFYSLHRDPDGRLIAGDSTGNVWLLENGTQDNGADIPIVIRFPSDSGGQPYRRKTAHDLLIEATTGGNDITVEPFLDGATSSANSYTANTVAFYTYHRNVYGLTDFSHILFQITGSVSRFMLRSVSLTYRIHPQQRMSMDTGYLLPPGNGDLAWVQEIEVSARSPVNLELVPTFDDVVKDTLTVSVTPNVYSTYRVPLKRGQDKGRKPRFVLRTTNSAAEGNPGFEMEWMRVRFRGTGNQTENTLTIAPEVV